MLQKFWYYALLAFLFCGTMAHSMMQEEDKEDVSRQPTEKKRIPPEQGGGVHAAEAGHTHC